MDLTNPPTNNDSKAALSKRDLFLSTFCCNQAWSIPENIVYYITKNPSIPKCYEKLIQICKHFFITNPIIIISQLDLYYYNSTKRNAYFNGHHIALKNISSRIWITSELNFHNYTKDANDQYFSSSVISKIYQIDAKVLMLRSQIISLNNLIFLASKCEIMALNRLIVKADYGVVAALEKVISVFPSIKEFSYDLYGITLDIITPKTIEELVKIPHFSNLDLFCLKNVTEMFDIERFYFYIKKNKKTKISIYYYDPKISDQYKNRIQKIINEIVQTKNHGYKVPYIYFPGIDSSSYKKLMDLC